MGAHDAKGCGCGSARDAADPGAAAIEAVYEQLPWLRPPSGSVGALSPRPPRSKSARPTVARHGAAEWSSLEQTLPWLRGDARSGSGKAAGSVALPFHTGAALLEQPLGAEILVFRGFRMDWDNYAHRVGRLDAIVLNGLGYGDTRLGGTVRLAPGCTGDEGHVALRVSLVRLSPGMAYFEPDEELEVETVWRLDSGDVSPGAQRPLVAQIGGPAGFETAFDIPYERLLRRDAHSAFGLEGGRDLASYPERAVFLQGFQLLMNEGTSGPRLGKCPVQAVSARIVTHEFIDSARVLRVLVRAGVRPGVVHFLDANQAVDEQVLRVFGRLRIGVLGATVGRFRRTNVECARLAAGLGGSASCEVPAPAGGAPDVRVWFTNGFDVEVNPVPFDPGEVPDDLPLALGLPTGLAPFLNAAVATQASGWPGRLVRRLGMALCDAEGATNVVETVVSNEGGSYPIEPQVRVGVTSYEGPEGSMSAQGVRYLAGWQFAERTTTPPAPPCEPLVAEARPTIDWMRQAILEGGEVGPTPPSFEIELRRLDSYEPDGGCGDA